MIKYLRWFPALAWMIVIFYFSGRQTTDVTGIASFHTVSIYWQRFIILKFFHLVEYGTLFYLILFASHSTTKSFIYGYLYACSDEFHQQFTPRRTSRISDTFIDLLGMFLGWLIINKLYPLFFKPPKNASA